MSPSPALQPRVNVNTIYFPASWSGTSSTVGGWYPLPGPEPLVVVVVVVCVGPESVVPESFESLLDHWPWGVLMLSADQRVPRNQKVFICLVLVALRDLESRYFLLALLWMVACARKRRR